MFTGTWEGKHMQDEELEGQENSEASEHTAVRAEGTGAGGQPPPGWSLPKPERVAAPTYWPAVMALGITMILWGVVTAVLISLTGLALFVLALAGWIGELLHENPEQ
jgi:hypothetical protein